jgi:hypothetical protein
VLMKKAFFDASDAVTTLQGIPKEDLLRILSVSVSPQLLSAFAEMTSKWEQVDLALLAVGLAHSFHSGYSTAIADGTEDKNLHLEYLNAQQRAAATTINGAAPGPARPHS